MTLGRDPAVIGIGGERGGGREKKRIGREARTLLHEKFIKKIIKKNIKNSLHYESNEVK